MSQLPQYVRAIVRKKDEAILAGLRFLTQLRKGEAKETGRTEAVVKLTRALNSDARRLADHPTYGGTG